jgi:hypothetical protein
VLQGDNISLKPLSASAKYSTYSKYFPHSTYSHIQHIHIFTYSHIQHIHIFTYSTYSHIHISNIFTYSHIHILNIFTYSHIPYILIQLIPYSQRNSVELYYEKVPEYERWRSHQEGYTSNLEYGKYLE